MKRLALLIAMAGISAPLPASEPSAPPSCVPDNSCGCSIVVTGSSCPSGGSHFFHELADGAPLHFSLDRGPTTAASTQATSNIFSPERGGSWTEIYRHGNDSIEIRYSPGVNTCAKAAQGEQCEYFDVRAAVLISGPQGTRQYSGAGTCGC